MKVEIKPSRLEICTKRGYRFVTGFSVYVDGKEWQPPFRSKREANLLKDELEAGHGEARGAGK